MNHWNICAGRIWEFKKPKGHDDGCFCDVVWMNWNLMVCFHQICHGEDSSQQVVVQSRQCAEQDIGWGWS